MSEEAEKRLAGLRIRESRKAAGLTQEALAKKVGLPQSVISDWERGVLQSWQDHVENLAAAVNQDPSYFATPVETEERVKTLSVRDIPVIGDVQGGDFRMAYEFPVEDREFISVAATAYPAYEGVELRALRVNGPSVNLLYPDGSYVIIMKASDTDVRVGDRVVVYREKAGLCESTIKEVGLEGDRVVLYPRSTHPDHQTPIYLDDEDNPRIEYVVVGSHRIEERPPPPIKWPSRR